MRRAILLLMLIEGLMMFPATANATIFTMDASQLAALYETWENPNHVGTYLNPVQPLPNGAKYTGNIRTNDPGWGAIQIGANFWGIPYGGSVGDKPSNVALGMGSLVGYDSYRLIFENVNENSWKYNLYFNLGWTDSPWSEPDYYVQNTWTEIPKDMSGTLILDFSNCEVWRNGTYLGWVDLTSYADAHWEHVTNIGFHVGQNVPVDSDDYTYEVKVYPIPEPASMLLLGIGLIGLAGGRVTKRFIRA